MKFLLVIFWLCLSTNAWSTETITIVSPASANHSTTPALFRIINEANSQQKEFNFILEFRPGGEQIIAMNVVKEQPQSRLVVIAPKFVEHVISGRINKHDFVPIHALGDACWAVISNRVNGSKGVAGLRGNKQLTVGGLGVGNAAHITALELGDRFDFQVRYIPFKSNFDAFVLLISDESINMVLERTSNYLQYKDKNPNATVIGMSCPNRHPDLPDVPTMAEQNAFTPYVFSITMAHANMQESKQRKLSEILNKATLNVGAKEIFRLSDMIPPVFSNINTQTYYQQRFGYMEQMLKKHQTKITSN